MPVREYPVSIKGVIARFGKVALLRNERAEWELPGGRLEPGESPEGCLRREALEELGLEVEVGPPLHAWLYEPVPGREVFVVAYECVDRGGRISRSGEHAAAGWFDVGRLSGINLPAGYRRAIDGWLAGHGRRRGFGRPGETPV